MHKWWFAAHALTFDAQMVVYCTCPHFWCTNDGFTAHALTYDAQMVVYCAWAHLWHMTHNWWFTVHALTFDAQMVVYCACAHFWCPNGGLLRMRSLLMPQCWSTALAHTVMIYFACADGVKRACVWGASLVPKCELLDQKEELASRANELPSGTSTLKQG